jgi:DNA-binding winged helix-turn-helix (wHTH) protein
MGAWLVRPSLNTISKNGTDVQLEPKVMEVLVCLASRAGESMSKETLIKTVWSDTFVSDDVLIRCVSELRKAFGDNASKPTVIETIPKKGYRLLVPVTRVLYRDPTRDRSGQEFIDSIAILPFENTGESAEFDYLSDGLTETIITNLSQLGRLRVLPSTVVSRYRGKIVDPARVGRELGVRIVLVGRVMQRDDRLTIGAELIETFDELKVLGRTYDRLPGDIFSIQDELSQEISDHLRLRVTGLMKQRLTRRRTDSPEAYHLFLKAVYWAAFPTPRECRNDAGPMHITPLLPV